MTKRVGAWICDGSPDPPYCSECMTFALEDKNGDYAMTNYCPECGARMCEIVRENVGAVDYDWFRVESIGNETNRNLKYVKYEPMKVTDR